MLVGLINDNWFICFVGHDMEEEWSADMAKWFLLGLASMQKP